MLRRLSLAGGDLVIRNSRRRIDKNLRVSLANASNCNGPILWVAGFILTTLAYIRDVPAGRESRP
jgi:hypothetical protein